jgi:hypothetical protein
VSHASESLCESKAYSGYYWHFWTLDDILPSESHCESKSTKIRCFEFPQFLWPRVHKNSQKSDASIFFNFHDPGYMKIHKNQTLQTLQFSSTFMTPGTWKFTKIRLFEFLQFLWPRVHKNSQKLDASIFFNFHDPDYMKIHKNQTIQFSSTFMTPGTWKFKKIKRMDFLQLSWPRPGTWKSTKIRHFNFLRLSWPRVHENSQKSDASDASIFFNFHETRVHENSQKSHTSIFFNFHKNPQKSDNSIFFRVHENPQKSNAWIFFDFHDLGYMKIHKNQTLQFSSTFMTPGTRKFTKIKCMDFLRLSWPRVHENPQKSDPSIFFDFHDPGYMKIHLNQTLQFSSTFMTPGTWKFTKIRRFRLFEFLQFLWQMKIHKN